MLTTLPEGVEGCTFTYCARITPTIFERVLGNGGGALKHLLRQAKWLNMGGGHLITHKEYKVEHLVQLLRAFKAKYPHLHIIMEPGECLAWQMGYLATGGGCGGERRRTHPHARCLLPAICPTAREMPYRTSLPLEEQVAWSTPSTLKLQSGR